MDNCARCKRESFSQVMLPFAETSESGKLNYLHEGKDSSVQIPVPLCIRCLVLAEEGFIFPVKEENSFYLNELCDEKGEFSISYFEKRAELGKLTKDIDVSLKKEGKTRTQVKKQKMKRSPLRIAIYVEESIKDEEKFANEVKEK